MTPRNPTQTVGRQMLPSSLQPIASASHAFVSQISSKSTKDGRDSAFCVFYFVCLTVKEKNCELFICSGKYGLLFKHVFLFVFVFLEPSNLNKSPTFFDELVNFPTTLEVHGKEILVEKHLALLSLFKGWQAKVGAGSTTKSITKSTTSTR